VFRVGDAHVTGNCDPAGTIKRVAALLLASMVACGDPGADGPRGTTGPEGPAGDDGAQGNPGSNGQDGAPGTDGKSCPTGNLLAGQAEGVSSSAPLSSVVALGFCDLANTNATNLADYVKALVVQYGTNARQRASSSRSRRRPPTPYARSPASCRTWSRSGWTRSAGTTWSARR